MTDKTSSAAKRHCTVVFAQCPGSETRVQRQAELLIREGFEVDVLCLREIGREAPEEVANGQTCTALWPHAPTVGMFALMRPCG